MTSGLIACGGGSPSSSDDKPDSLLPPDLVLSSSSSSVASSGGSNSSSGGIVKTSLPIYENFEAIFFAAIIAPSIYPGCCVAVSEPEIYNLLFKNEF